MTGQPGQFQKLKPEGNTPHPRSFPVLMDGKGVGGGIESWGVTLGEVPQALDLPRLTGCPSLGQSQEVVRSTMDPALQPTRP